MFVNRWCIFGPYLANVLDLRWRQVNVAMWSTRFNFVIRIASIKFQKLTPARKDLKFGFLLNYMFIYLWHCSWRYKIWRYMKFMHCNHTFALSYWICIWKNRSRIGAVSTGTATHIEIKQCGCSPHFLPWDLWVEVKSCIALHHLHMHWGIFMKHLFISLPDVILSLYDTSFYQIINLMFNQTVIWIAWLK